jgi:hypothetical protein
VVVTIVVVVVIFYVAGEGGPEDALSSAREVVSVSLPSPKTIASDIVNRSSSNRIFRRRMQSGP